MTTSSSAPEPRPVTSDPERAAPSGSAAARAKPGARTILVTGATSGIGRHAALHLARQGHHVFATGRNVAALASLADEARGLPLETLRLDVTSEASIRDVQAEIVRRTAGRGLDIVINNAGYGQPGPVDVVPDADVRAQFETNVFGLLSVTRAFVPEMRRRGSGRIINVSSVGGRVTLPLFGVYNATKFAVEALSDAMRVELQPFGIDVVVIEPGVINTGFADRSRALVDSLPTADSAYAPLLARADAIQARAEALGVGPEHTSRAIARAVNARRPRTRYVTPRLAQVQLAVMKLMPTRLLDWVFRRILGHTRKSVAGTAAGANAAA